MRSWGAAFICWMLLAAGDALASLALLQTTPESVTLSWEDGINPPETTRYWVYHSLVSGSYVVTDRRDAEGALTFGWTGLAGGKHWWVVTAYNSVDPTLESGYSNEVSSTVMVPPTGLHILSQSASLRWFGVVLLAQTDLPAKSYLQYRKLEVGAKQTTVMTSPEPVKTLHRAVLYFPPGKTFYTYTWTITSATGEMVTGTGTFQTR